MGSDKLAAEIKKQTGHDVKTMNLKTQKTYLPSIM